MLEDLLPALAGYLARQRWFAGGSAESGGARVVAAEPLREGPPALVELVAEVAGARAGDEPRRYQLPVGIRVGADAREFAARAGAAVIGPVRWRGEPGIGYDALHDPVLACWLLDRLRTAEPVGDAGWAGTCPVRFRRVAAFTGGESPAVRPVGSEQSNSSLVFGERLILKVFRRLEAGESPELELTAALAAGGFTGCAPPLAWADGLGATLMLLQPFFAGSRDGFELAAARSNERCLAGPAAGGFGEEARQLGRVVAGMHAVLATLRCDDAARDVLPATLAAGWLAELEAAVAVVPELREHSPAVATAYRAAARAPALAAQRIHGDLHLGQVLLDSGAGWIVLDFEGEPARPLRERRRPASPLRDVAGMLRSFDYAAFQPLLDAERVDELAGAAAAWAGECRAAFLDGYREVAPGAADPRAGALLRAFELEKAVYEVRYEAHHRPGWVAIPLGGIARILAS